VPFPDNVKLLSNDFSFFLAKRVDKRTLNSTSAPEMVADLL
jgi:hypothetical protein